MKTFSRLTMLFTFLSMAFVLVGTADAQDPFLTVISSEGFEGTPIVDQEVTVKFIAGRDEEAGGDPDIPLTITSGSGVMIDSIDPADSETSLAGVLTVKGRITQNGVDVRNSIWIQASWRQPTDENLVASAEIDTAIPPPGIGPVVIVVNPPTPKSPLSVGSTFTQMISLTNENAETSSLPLSAWQMDVVFNPLILEVVEVTEGDFLEKDGEDAVYAEMIRPGKISVSQARAGQMANAAPPPANVASADSPAGIALAPGDKGTLLTIQFRVLAVAEEALGIHNVQLQSDEDFDENGTPDRLSYSIKVLDVFVATEQSSAAEDVNQDGMVNILDLVAVAGSIGMVPGNPRGRCQRRWVCQCTRSHPDLHESALGNIRAYGYSQKT